MDECALSPEQKNLVGADAETSAAPASVAVVVVFRECSGFVDQCLDAIQRMEGGPWPLIMVPDKFVPEYEGRGTQIPFVGTIAAKRNRGIAAAADDCKYIAFVDSDAYPTPSWLAQVCARFSQMDRRTAAITGPNLTPPQDSLLRRVPGLAIESKLIMGEGAFRFTNQGATEIDNFSYATTCNLVVRRDVLQEIGGFNKKLLTAEDVGLCDAMIGRGYRIFYDPTIIVYHHRRDLFRFWLQHFNEGLHVKYYLNFTHIRRRPVFFPSLLVIGELLIGLAGHWWLFLGLLQAAQLLVYFLDRRRAAGTTGKAALAAVSMWGFLKAYGLGGILSFVGGDKFYLSSRHDPDN